MKTEFLRKTIIVSIIITIAINFIGCSSHSSPSSYEERQENRARWDKINKIGEDFNKNAQRNYDRSNYNLQKELDRSNVYKVRVVNPYGY